MRSQTLNIQEILVKYLNYKTTGSEPYKAAERSISAALIFSFSNKEKGRANVETIRQDRFWAEVVHAIISYYLCFGNEGIVDVVYDR